MAAVVQVVESSPRPVQVPELPVDDASAVIGRQVAALLPEGAVLQYGPGAIGRAVLSAVDRPVRIWSGVVTDAVVDLDRRGLLRGDTVATYAVGTDTLYEWIDGRSVLTRVERSHDLTALADVGIWAINTALEIDLTGQINVERIGSDVIAGIGGHADFASAGARSVQGASVIALPSRRGGRSTLVERLGCPTSTPRSDVDIVVTEHGVADLRGLDDAQRSRALQPLWPDGTGA
jgi:acyl-CoA hydrolase